MNLLGKILTMLIFLCSICFLMLAVVTYATHQNWRDLVMDPQKGMKAQIVNLTNENIRLREERDRMQSRLATEQAARRSSISTLQTTLEQRTEELARTEERLGRLQAQATIDAETLKSSADTLQRLTNEVAKIRDDIRLAQAQRDTVFDLIVKVEENLNASEGNVLTLNERVIQLQDQYSLAARVLQAHDLTPTTSVDRTPPKTDGVINKVGANNLVEISLGSDDGIREGHTLEVYRNNQYLGRILVRKVEPDRAVAEILKDYRKGIIRQGDRVATKLI